MKRKLMILSIFLVALLAVSAVSAADDAASDIASIDNDINETVISTDNSISIEDKVGATEENKLTAGTFDDLQTEINNAPEGSVLNLTRDYNGEEDKVVWLNKDLTIDGQGHTIDCLGDDCSAFYSDAGTITLKNLKIINGHNDDNYKGGAIYIGDSAKYTIINCTFNNNWADDFGGAIYNGANPLTIINCSFNNNKVDDDDGGAIYCVGKLYVENSTFNDNFADNNGGAIYYAGTEQVKIINCQFNNNKADDDNGGAIYTKAKIYLKNSIFTGNTAKENGGAVEVVISQELEKDEVNIDSCTFENNSAGNNGGAVTDWGEVKIFNSTFRTNTAGNNGGAITGWVNSAESQTLSYFIGNTAEKGGAIYGSSPWLGSEPNISSAYFYGNKATEDGGAIYSFGHVNVYDSIFDSNRAEGATARSNGGAINTEYETHVFGCRFVNNYAENNGGAIYAATVKVQSYSYFENNEAYKGAGGAIWGGSFLKLIQGGVFIGNKAGRGAPISDDGGAIYIDDAYLGYTFITQCIFIKNSCTDEGGAIYANTADDHLSIKYNVFIDNTAGDKGQTVYNCGEYDAVEYNWHGTNTPNFADQFKKWHSGSSDTDYTPLAYARIGLKINDTDFYKGNTYKLTLYYYPVKDGSPTPSETINIPFTEIFFSGDAEFSNPDNHKESTKNINFTKNDATVYAQLDYEKVSLKVNAKNKTPTSVNITSCESIYYHETLKVKYEISKNNNATYEIRNSTGQVIANGNITDPHELLVDSLGLGQYVLTIINPETFDCLPSNASASFSVKKGLYANVTADNVVYGNPTTITLRSSVDGKYNVSINDSVVEMEVVNGTCTKQVMLNAGNYTTKTTFIAPEYETQINETAFAVAKADVALRIVVSDCIYPESVNGTIFTNTNGSYTVKIKNYTTTIDVKNNVGEFDADTFDAGIYTATVIFDGDANHNANSNTTTFTVKKPVDFKINANTTDIVYGDSIKVTPTFDDEVNGTIKYSIDGNVLCEVSANESVILPELDAGSHDIVAEYSGDEIHEKANATLKINIKKATNNVKINAKDVTYGMASIIEITADADGTYHVDINGNEIEVTVLNNKGNASINLDAGTYHTSTHFNSKNYESQITEADFKVNKANITLSVAIGDETYGEDINGHVYASVDGTYTLTIGNYKTNIAVEDGVGLINETLILDAGNYEANISFAGDNNHNPALNKTTFHVNKADTTLYVIALDAEYPNTVWGAVLTDCNDTIKIYVNDEFKLSIDVDDVEVFDLGILKVGEYNITAVFDGNKNYNNASNTSSFNVTEGNFTFTISTNATSFIYKETIVITHTLTEGATGTIKYYLYNGTMLGEADVSENFTLPVLDCREYIIVANYSGDDNYPSAMSMINIAIEKAPNTAIVNVENTTYGLESIINVHADEDGEYSVNINGTRVTVNVLNGKGNKTVILDAGSYTTHTTFASDNYQTTVSEANFEVEKAETQLSIIVTHAVYLEDVEGVVYANTDGKYNITVGNSSIIVEVKNGQGKFNIGTFDIGNYNATVKFNGNKNYKENTNTTEFTVGKADITLTISIMDLTYPEEVIVHVHASVDGEYTIIVGEFNTTVDVSNHKADKIIGTLDAGEYKGFVIFKGNDHYNNNTNSTVFTVNKADPMFKITTNQTEFVYGSSITITHILTENATGTITYYLSNGTRLDQKSINENYTLPILNAGKYSIVGIYDGDVNYNNASSILNLSIAKAIVNAEVSVDDVTYGEEALIAVTGDIDGEYIVDINGTKVTVNVENGSGQNTASLNAGNYSTKTTFVSDNYDSKVSEANFEVKKANNNIKIVAEDSIYGTPYSFYITCDFDGEYTANINDVPVNVTVQNGTGIYNAGIIGAGNYNISITYPGNENINPSNASASITIFKADVNITVETKDISPSGVVVTAIADYSGNYTLFVDTTSPQYIVLEAGVAKEIPIHLGIGTYNITVAYPGDDNHNTASASVEVTVKPQGIIIAEDIRRGVNSSYDYYATLVNAEGKPISDVEITFTIEGKTYKAKTNTSGIATVSAGLEVVDGKDTVYNVTVTNPYTLENTTATTTIVPRLIVVSGDLTADYLENPPYIVQAIGDDGEHVGANVTVRIVFAGFYYDLQTNETGHVVRTIALAPGTYAVRGEYLGYKTEQTPFKVLQILKASSGTLKKTAKSYTLKATLKHTNGKAIAGAKVKLNFNGKTYTVKTNSKGVASYTIKSSVINKLKAGKTYVLKALYINDWTRGQWQGKIKVKK